MPKQKKKIQHKCSVCRKVGHNKLKCPSLKLVNSAPLQQVQGRSMRDISARSAHSMRAKNIKKNSAVLVQVLPKHIQSPHIVNLKSKEESVWDKVKVYHEKEIKKEKRTVVDFGKMVRVANAPKSRIKNEELRIKTKNRKKKEFSLPKINVSFVCKWKDSILDNINSSFFILHSSIKSFNYKKLAYFAIVLLVLISLPFPAIGYYNDVKDTSTRVVEASTNAFLSLQSFTVAAFNANIDQAQFDLSSALTSFSEASSIIETEHQVLQYVVRLLPVVGTQVKGRQSLLSAGHHLALGNTYLVKGIREAGEETQVNMTDKFAILSAHLRSAIPQYRAALGELNAIDPEVIPWEYRQSFVDFKILFSAFIDDMNDLVNLSQSLNMIFGSEEFRRYLVVFQNNHELRPTGGFMGSFAILDVQKGKVMNWEIPGGGTYDLQGQLDESVIPPLPLQLTNKKWEFQDANWFSDFSASAEKMAWFYNHGRGATVDGVIAINASVLERLLAVLGPIKNENYDLEISSADALSKIQVEVELEYDKEKNEPKAVLSDLTGQFISRLPELNTMNAIQLLTELYEALNEKEIQLYFKNDKEQKHFSAFGWTGEIEKIDSNQDYLLVVNANIQGQKSDAKIIQTIDHQSVIQEDGTILDTVIIEREHTGKPGEMFYGVNNVDYIRIYAPLGAQLVEAGGFVYPPEDAFKVPDSWSKEDSDLKNKEIEIGFDKLTGTRITNEFGKTVFGNWSMVEPGQITKVYFTYKLPFKLDLEQTEKKSIDNFTKWKVAFVGEPKSASSYSLLVQKQSGINSQFNTRIIYPDNWSPVWKNNEKINLAQNGGEYSDILLTDIKIGLVMERSN